MECGLRVFVITLLFLALPSISLAGDRWTKDDTGFQLAYTALHMIDWGQTRYIAKNLDKHSELNAYLGRSPSIGKVNTYFATTLVLHGMVSYVLPQPWRRFWQFSFIRIRDYDVERNFTLGIKVDF